MGSLDFEFLGFAALAILLFHLSRSRVWRQVVILAASLVFLISFGHGVAAFLPITGFLAAGYLAILVVQRAPRAFVPSVIAIVVFFAWLRKYVFFPHDAFLRFAYVGVGLSYILFRVIHLIIESRYNPGAEKPGPLRYLTYTIFFPAFVAGPIQNWSDFARCQFAREPLKLNLTGWAQAFERLIRGYFKVNVAAALFYAMHTRALTENANASAHSMWVVVIAFAAYPFFLYCNFSGYIDAAIAIARMLGIILPENFDSPFSADSFIGFWSRWHITLSQWLKTYVYNPLLMGLMRRYPSAALEPVWAVSAFFLTFFLIGAWHGQTGAFLFFGVLQGLGVSVNKLWQLFLTARMGAKRYRAVSAHPLYRMVARGATFTWFAFTLIWFWASWTQAGHLFHSMPVPVMAGAWLAILACSTVGIELWALARHAVFSITYGGLPFVESRYWRTAWNTGLAVIWLTVAAISHQSAPDIVYKAF